MKKSFRLFLPDDDFDGDLVTAQMNVKYVAGLGACGYKPEAIRMEERFERLYEESLRNKSPQAS